MPKKIKAKAQKTFFRIKEKLVLLPPKKFFGRKFLGIIFLIFGSLILTVSLVYFYLLPKFFPGKTQEVKVEEVKEEQLFLSVRVLIPEASLDFPVINGLLEIQPPLKLTNVKKDKEIIVFSKDKYASFRIVEVKTEEGANLPSLEIVNSNLKLILPMKIKPAKIMVIEAIKMEEIPK